MKSLTQSLNEELNEAVSVSSKNFGTAMKPVNKLLGNDYEKKEELKKVVKDFFADNDIEIMESVNESESVNEAKI